MHMRVCGIIAEYNPFHSGHAYQITEARRRSGCDYLIAVMSGDFVQRGAPAIIDKYVRARMALEAGADLVLMLPVYASTASAEGFARAGVSALHTTGVTDALSFGCEDPAICSEPYRDLARRLSHESPEFQSVLRSALSDGLPYAQARTDAIHACYGDACDPALLDHPNNLLAFEYLRAIEYLHAGLQPYPIRRLGSYHGSASDAGCPDASGTPDHPQNYLSAGACRELLAKDPHAALNTLYREEQLPERSYELLQEYTRRYAFVAEQDLSAALHYALLAQRSTGYGSYLDCSQDLSARIRQSLPAYTDFSKFCDLLKNKSLSRARIARVLMHILLQLPADPPAPLIDTNGCLPYLRVLGFRSSATDLLHEIKQRSHAPLITRPAQAHELLTAEADTYFAQDIFASDVYRSVLSHKCGRHDADDYRRRIEIV